MKQLVLILMVLFLPVSLYAEPYTEPVAISVGPTAQEIKFAAKNKTEEEYSSWVDHGTYYSYWIEKTIEEMGIPVVDSDQLAFEFSVDGVIHPFSLKNREHQWSIIIFNGVDPPRETDPVYDPEMKSYFEKSSPDGEEK